MFKVKTWRGAAASFGAQIAIEERLFISGWDLRWHLGLMTESTKLNDNTGIAIGYVNDEAVCTVVDLKIAMAFCREAHRRNGYCSKALKGLMKNRPGEKSAPTACAGIEGSENFWALNGVPLGYYHRGI